MALTIPPQPDKESWPELLMKNIIPFVMAGVLGIYGLVVAVILVGVTFRFPWVGLLALW